MQKFLVKILAGILFFYSKEKRKEFRSRYSTMSIRNRKLRKKGILGSNSYIYHTSTVRDNRSRIGKFCSIAPNVSIGTTSHPTNYLSTSPIPYKDIDWNKQVKVDRNIPSNYKRMSAASLFSLF